MIDEGLIRQLVERVIALEHIVRIQGRELAMWSNYALAARAMGTATGASLEATIVNLEELRVDREHVMALLPELPDSGDLSDVTGS